MPDTELPVLPPSDKQREEYDREIQQKIEDADYAAKDCHEVTILVSRQEYKDLLEAMRFMRQINKWYASIGKRMERLALRIRDGLDKKGVPALMPFYMMHTMGISPRRLVRCALLPFGIWI